MRLFFNFTNIFLIQCSLSNKFYDDNPRTFDFCLAFCGSFFGDYLLAISKRYSDASAILSWSRLDNFGNYTFHSSIYISEKQIDIVLD